MKRREQLLRAVQDMIGIRWCDWGRSPSTGFDCVGLLIWAYGQCGIVPRDWRPPTYCIAGGLLDSDLLPRALADLGFSAADEMMPGDVITFRVPRTVWHAGIVLDRERFAHAMRGYGVIISMMADPTWARRRATIWRPPWDS